MWCRDERYISATYHVVIARYDADPHQKNAHAFRRSPDRSPNSDARLVGVVTSDIVQCVFRSSQRVSSPNIMTTAVFGHRAGALVSPSSPHFGQCRDASLSPSPTATLASPMWRSPGGFCGGPATKWCFRPRRGDSVRRLILDSSRASSSDNSAALMNQNVGTRISATTHHFRRPRRRVTLT